MDRPRKLSVTLYQPDGQIVDIDRLDALYFVAENVPMPFFYGDAAKQRVIVVNAAAIKYATVEWVPDRGAE